MIIEVNGIRFWGEDKGLVTMDDVEMVSSPRDSILHLLRHFSQVSEDWCRQAVANEFATQEFINEQLAMPGSKWNPAVGLSIPEDVICFAQVLFRRALQNGQELRWIGRGEMDFCFLSQLILPKEKNQLLSCNGNAPIGAMGLIPIKDIPSHIKVERRFNRGGVVNVVEMEPIDTDSVALTLVRRNTGIIQIYSAFPGILTPPVPRKSQPLEEQEYNESFWGRHALIESNNRKGGTER